MKNIIPQVLQLEKALYESIEINIRNADIELRNRKVLQEKEREKSLKIRIKDKLRLKEKELSGLRVSIKNHLKILKKPNLKHSIEISNIFFDSDFYSKKYGIPKKIGKIHYLLFGRHKNLNITPYIDLSFISDNYGIENVNILNFLYSGVNLGLRPNRNFNPSWYLRNNVDVAESRINPLHHYIIYGWKEKRSPSSEFDSTRYLNFYPDVSRSNIDPLLHYILYGSFEKRKTFKVGSAKI